MERSTEVTAARWTMPSRPSWTAASHVAVRERLQVDDRDPRPLLGKRPHHRSTHEAGAPRHQDLLTRKLRHGPVPSSSSRAGWQVDRVEPLLGSPRLRLLRRALGRGASLASRLAVAGWA